MIVNFSIDNNISLVYKGHHLDLHNNFDFIGYKYEIKERKLILTWVLSSDNWVTDKKISNLTLVHSNVFFINISYDNSKYEYPEDDNCIGEISFFPSSSRDIVNHIIDQPQPKDGDDIVYNFESGHFIRVGCDKVEVTID